MAEKINSIPSDMLDWLQEKSIDMQRLMTYYKCAMLEVETKFRVLDSVIVVIIIFHSIYYK